MTIPSEPPAHTEQTSLPDWFYPAGFWAAVLSLGLALIWPRWAGLAVGVLGALPVGATAWVALANRQRDPVLSRRAALTLLGLALIVVLATRLHR